MIFSLMLMIRQPGDLGVLRGVAEGVAEEARTRGFASPALAGFAFIDANLPYMVEKGQFGEVLRMALLGQKPSFYPETSGRRLAARSSRSPSVILHVAVGLPKGIFDLVKYPMRIFVNVMKEPHFLKNRLLKRDIPR